MEWRSVLRAGSVSVLTVPCALKIKIAQAETYEAVDLRVGKACVACGLAVLTLYRMRNLAGLSPSTIEFATTADREALLT